MGGQIMANETLPPFTEITVEVLDDMAASCRGFVDSMMQDHPAHLRPQMLVQVRRPEETKPVLHVIVFDVPFNEARDKQLAIAGQGLRYYQERLLPIAWFLISECWRSRDMYTKDGR